MQEQKYLIYILGAQGQAHAWAESDSQYIHPENDRTFRLISGAPFSFDVVNQFNGVPYWQKGFPHAWRLLGADESGAGEEFTTKLFHRRDDAADDDYSFGAYILSDRDMRLELQHDHTKKHSSDVRSEINIFISRQCLINALGRQREDKVIEAGLLPAEEAISRGRIQRAITGIDKDVKSLRTSEQEHMPHFAPIAIIDALVQGQGQVVILTQLHEFELLGNELASRLLSEHVDAQQDMLSNIIENLREDADKADSGRLVGRVDIAALARDAAAVQGIYDLAVLMPPQYAPKMPEEDDSEAPDSDSVDPAPQEDEPPEDAGNGEQ